jgi:hypothetical protein
MKVLIIILLGGVYLFSFLNFVHIYFLRNPIYNAESFAFSSRVVSKYVALQKDAVYVVNSNPKTPLKQYLFYTNSLTKETTNTIARMYKDHDYTYKNIHFISCNTAASIPAGSIILSSELNCKNVPKSTDILNVVQLSDAGTIYTIQHDTLCSTYTLKRYPSNLTFSNLSIEQLSIKDFCETFIVKY